MLAPRNQGKQVINPVEEIDSFIPIGSALENK